VFMYFLRGGLPWQGLKAATNKQKYEKIGEKKQSTPIKELCEGFPEEFNIYLNYVRKLGFEETPDYDFLRELFTKVLKNSGEAEDGVYDWMMLNNGKGWEASSVRSTTNLLPNVQQPYGEDRRHRSSGIQRDRERERAERHHQRVSQQASATGGIVPPSPALVRHGSKQGRKSSGIPANAGSAAAVAGVSPPTGAGAKRQSSASQGLHPYATGAGAGVGGAAAGVGGGYERDGGAYDQGGYSRGAPGVRGGAQETTGQNMGGMSPTQRAMGLGGGAGGAVGTNGEVGNMGNGNYMDHDERGQGGGGFSLIKILTCRCG